MATPKYTKIDERFGVIEYLVTLGDMVEIFKELQKLNVNIINMLLRI